MPILPYCLFPMRLIPMRLGVSIAGRAKSLAGNLFFLSPKRILVQIDKTRPKYIKSIVHILEWFQKPLFPTHLPRTWNFGRRVFK